MWEARFRLVSVVLALVAESHFAAAFVSPLPTPGMNEVIHQGIGL